MAVDLDPGPPAGIHEGADGHSPLRFLAGAVVGRIRRHGDLFAATIPA